MKEELKTLLGELSPSDFSKIKLVYSFANGIKGDTIEEFTDGLSDKTMQGMINLCNKQLGK